VTTEIAADVESPGEAPEGSPPRWYTRALPVTAAAVGIVAVAALVSPGLRHQLVLSTSHQPQSYAELYFDQAPDGTRATCTRSADGVEVGFVVASHLDDEDDLAYVVSVASAAATGATEVQEGSVHVVPGRATQVARGFAAPRGAYDVSVRLRGLDQEIRAHCGGPGA